MEYIRKFYRLFDTTNGNMVGEDFQDQYEALKWIEKNGLGYIEYEIKE